MSGKDNNMNNFATWRDPAYRRHMMLPYFLVGCCILMSIYFIGWVIFTFFI